MGILCCLRTQPHHLGSCCLAVAMHVVAIRLQRWVGAEPTLHWQYMDQVYRWVSILQALWLTSLKDPRALRNPKSWRACRSDEVASVLPLNSHLEREPNIAHLVQPHHLSKEEYLEGLSFWNNCWSVWIAKTVRSSEIAINIQWTAHKCTDLIAQAVFFWLPSTYFRSTKARRDMQTPPWWPLIMNLSSWHLVCSAHEIPLQIP